MAKKKNSRKALAVALGIMGVAGLSLASASSLTVNPSNEVAMGTSSLFASCDTAVGITYGYDAVSYKINSVTVTGIADACANKPVTVKIANVTTAGSPVTASAPSMAAWVAGGASDDRSYTMTITTPTVPLTDDLGAATVIIG